MTGAELFDGLDDALPLALLPVRLVTRFHRPDPHSPPAELHVRIHPDVIHADSHDPTLTEQEQVLGKEYWNRVTAAHGDDALLTDARSWLADQVDPYRALWVAASMQPGKKGVTTRTTPRATIARLLPARWLAVGYVNNEEVGRWWSRTVTADLPMAPNLATLETGDGIRAFLRRQGLQWMVDFEAAVTVGMALKIPLDNVTATVGFSQLIVVGVSDRPDDTAGLAALLSAHRYTEGLDFVPQGSPTNNTDAAASAVSTDAPDLAPLFASEFATVLPRGRPALTTAPLLYRMAAANGASTALGLTGANALDRAPNATLAESSRAHAMNQVLWGATVEYLLSSPLAYNGKPALRGADLAWLRTWFCDYVRGGTALPAVRIGEQPYGLLPVTSMPFGAAFWTPTNSREWLEQTVADLFDNWIASVADAPSLSPVPGGVRPGTAPGDEAVTVASVLGAVPHPMRLRLRVADDEFDALRDEWEDQLDDFDAALNRVDDNYRTLARNYYVNREDAIRGDGGVIGQLDNLALLRGEYETEWTGNEANSPFAELIDLIHDVLTPTLERHADRAKLRLTVSGLPQDAALADADDPRLWYVLYEEDDEQAPTLKVVDDDPAALAAMLRRLADPEPGPVVTIPPGVPIPLLHRLIRRSAEAPPADFAAELNAAILQIADIADGELADPGGELERLTAETLGLLSHRLDAWHASLAAERLAQKRVKRPSGIQVGAYGWVLNLAPDLGEPDTQGFIHAPSLAHAATAAVLRSAWSAFSTDAGAAAYAVDLSSDRVRRADWILAGVRNGQSLEQLLGGRFERRLHDALLDAYIDEIRSAVLTGQGNTAPTSEIVDGLALAEAYADIANPPAGDPVRTTVDAAIAGDDAKRLQALLHENSVDLDAVTDALTAQAVHSVLTGDLAEAAAATAAMGSGDSGVPELSYAHLQRESDLVTHRVVALLGNEPPAIPSLLGTLEPAVSAWAERLVAGLEKGTCRITFTPGGSVTFPLGALGLTAYELLALADSSRLVRLVGGWARRFKAPGPVESVDVQLPDVLAALGPLRQAIGRARPIDAPDLARDEVASTPDIGELDARRGAAARYARALGQAAVSDELLRTRLADLVAIDDAGTIAALETEDPAARATVLETLSSRAEAVALALESDLPEDWDVGDLTARLAAATRIPIPVLPRFTAPDAAGLARAFSAGASRPASTVAIPAWLLQVGRVHAAAGLLHEGLGLLELASDTPRAVYGLAQLPDVAGEPWAAVSQPAGARTCIVSVTDAQAPLAQTTLRGMLFDAWIEPVPRGDVMTGVAVHFDSPSARPPQAVLLLTAVPDPGFNVNSIVEILGDTLDMTRCRAIGTETLVSLGHYLPGLFLPEGYAVEVA